MAHSRPPRYTNWYLKDWMHALGVRQTDLIERTGWSKATVSLLVNNRQDYSPTIIRDIALALHLAPHELLMHPEDAMGLRQLRQDAMRVVATSENLSRTGTEG